MVDLVRATASLLVLIFCISRFYCSCSQIPDINNIKEEGFTLAHGFRGVSPSWHGGHDYIKLLTSWHVESREKMSYRERPGIAITPKDMPKVNYFLRLGPTC
jgi:hypothetical protein